MIQGTNPLEIVGAYGARIDARAQAFLARNDYAMYGMMRYFMGYTDEQFNPVEARVGKRVRPGLLLLIAEGYGISDDAIPSALSIELFHNFTLIHDDICDHDESRRGRPTVWKLWGVDHAINTGDGQLILALRALEEPSPLSHEVRNTVRTRLLERYLEVVEGQFLDFSLATTKLRDSFVSKETYLSMLQKKTAKLVRASTEVAPMLVGRSAEEVGSLGDFGENLGMAYQLYDDWQGIWGMPEKTGKKRAGDIYEHKKTLPVIHALAQLGKEDAQRLEEIYDGATISESMVEEVLSFFAQTGAQQELEKHALHYKAEAVRALMKVTLPQEVILTLESIAHALIPDIIIESR